MDFRFCPKDIHPHEHMLKQRWGLSLCSWGFCMPNILLDETSKTPPQILYFLFLILGKDPFLIKQDVLTSQVFHLQHLAELCHNELGYSNLARWWSWHPKTPLYSSVSFHFVIISCWSVLLFRYVKRQYFHQVSKVWSNAGVGFFVADFFSFNSNFILLLFCKIIGEDMQWSRFIPNYFTGSVSRWTFLYLFFYLLQFLLFFFFSCIHTSFHPLNFSATPVISDSFLHFMAAPGVSPGIQEQLQGLGPKKAGWKHFRWCRCVLSHLHQWCERAL